MIEKFIFDANNYSLGSVAELIYRLTALANDGKECELSLIGNPLYCRDVVNGKLFDNENIKVVYPALKTGLLPDLQQLCTLYKSVSNWWNQYVAYAPVDPNSDKIINYIASLGNEGKLHPDFAQRFGIPIIGVDDSNWEPVTFTNTLESDAGPYPIPIAARTDRRYIESGEQYGDNDTPIGDNHIIMYHIYQRKMYELAYARYLDRWTARYGAIFDLNSNYIRKEGITSTDAAGLCVGAGLVRYDEVYGLMDSRIRHAFRCSIRKTNGHVFPASHTGARDAGAPPLGMRLRLKRNKDIGMYSIPIRKIFQAMKDHGLIVADRGGNVYVQGTMDYRWNNEILNPAFHSLNIRDFEVIELGWRGPL